MNLVERLYTAVTTFEGKEAMRYKQNDRWQSITYRQLWDSITHFAAGLQASGVKSGDKVAILSENCPEWVIADFAILGLGAVTVPIYPTIPAEQVGYILQNADVTTVIVEDRVQLKKVQEVWKEPLQRVIRIREDASTEVNDIAGFWDVVRKGSTLPDNTSAIQMEVIDDHQLATIVHTSGTSGMPKGVMLSHRNIVTNVQAALLVLPVEPSDVTLSYLPLSHIFERTVEEFALLSTGATVCYAEGIEQIQANLKEVCPTILVTVPRLLEKVYSGIQAKLEAAPRPIRRIVMVVMESEKSAGLTNRLVDWLIFRKLRAGLGGRVRGVVSGGAGLAREIAVFYTKAGIPIFEGYGMTEAAPIIAANPFDANQPGTVGKPLPGVEVRTADDGELLVRGANVMMGYYRQKEETQRTISGDGWLHTGDMAEIQPDGYIRIVDRKKNIIVLATGKNVAPFPIENAISLCPHISDAILVGDGLKFVSALIAPDFASLKPISDELGLGTDTAQWVQRPEIRQLIQREVSEAVAKFAPFEQPKRIALLPHELTIEGGDMTPSMKVRMKVIRAKYGHLIEGIYSGTDYIPVLVGDAVEAEPSATATESMAATGAAAAPVKRRVKGRYLVGIVVALLVVSGGALAVHGKFKIPATANLNGQLAAVARHNGQIGQVNGQIVGAMHKVDTAAGMTSQINSNLRTLQSGISTQHQSLGQLQDLSSQQVVLSGQLEHLSASLTHSLSTVDASVVNESGSVRQMSASANQLANAASQLLAVNRQSAAKLAQARSYADQIAAEMP